MFIFLSSYIYIHALAIFKAALQCLKTTDFKGIEAEILHRNQWYLVQGF